MKNKTPSEKGKQIAGDDRNIVAVDEAYKEAGFEDRLYLIWEKYSSWIVSAIIAVFVGLILFFALEYLAERREAAIQGEYAAAVTIEEKAAFAREHAGHRLAGTAALEVADSFFAEEAYQEAVENYRLAADSLGRHVLNGRARLGEAMSLIMLERREEAEPVLSRLAADQDVLLAIRMEAYYSLASLAFERGDYDRVVELADLIEAEDMMGFWSGRVGMLLDEIP
jgi:hypothetical protein